MPLVQLAYAGNPDEETKTRLIERFSTILVEELKVPPGSINVLLTHIAPVDWGVAGVPLAVAFRERERMAGHGISRIPRSVWTQSAGLRLHALDFAGTAPALLIVPGITSPAATWRFVVEALDLPNRVVVLDNRGRGWSDAPDRGYSREDYADDIAAWCRELTLDRPILLGHSMGARAAAVHAARTPGTALIAVDPPMSGPDRPYPSPLSFYLDGMQAVAAGADVESFRSTSPGWSDARIKDRIDWLPTCSLSAISESHAHFHDEGFLDVWESAGANALFVRGKRSPVVTVEDLDDVRAAAPMADIAEVEDAGHMIPWDNLGGFIATVRPWIARLSAQRPPSGAASEGERRQR